MAWRLALDLGTNSIGWAAFDLESEKDRLRPIRLAGAGVRIFSDGREPAADGRVGDPKALNRRLARGMRRNRDRRQGRIRDIAGLLIDAGLLPEEPEERQALMDTCCPYEARAQAARGPVCAYTLGRALFHLGKRRGFKSNRITDGDEETGGKLAEAQESLEAELGGLTLGQWQNARRAASKRRKEDGEAPRETHAMPRVRFRDGSSFYPTRGMYEAEFDAIKTAQENHHTLKPEQWAAIKDRIFYQRPLRPVDRGRCRFFPEDKRLFRAMPSAQRFRIAQDVTHLEWVDGERNAHKLNPDQRKAILEQLERQRSLSFSSMRKLKKDGTLLFPDAVQFNREDSKNKGLSGNATACDMRDTALFGDTWDRLSLDEQDEIVGLLFEADNEKPIREAAARYGLDQAETEKLVAKRFTRATASIGVTLARAAIPLMEQGKTYSAAVAAIEGPDGRPLHHSIEDDCATHETLPYYGELLAGNTVGGDPTKPKDATEAHWGRIPNPTVHIALNQVRTVVNRLVERFGKPDQIVIEVGRQLKNSAAERARIMSEQARFEKENAELAKEARELGIAIPSRADLNKIRLWRELGEKALDRACPYCGATISASQIASGEAEIEHILPFARTLDDTRANKTVAHIGCNRDKGNRTPHEAFGSTALWQGISAVVERLPKSKRWRFQPDAMERFNRNGDFLARQANDNAYIARLARRYLRALTCDTWTTTGQLTAWLRTMLRLNAPELGLGEAPHPWKKNRHDHRHHAVDAITIGLIDRSLLQSVNTQRASDGRVRIRFEKAVADRAWIVPQARDVLARILVSIKPDHGIEGPFFQERAYGTLSKEQMDATHPDKPLISRLRFTELKETELPRIRDPRIREEVVAWMKEQEADNRKIEEKLAEFASEWERREGKPLHSVRILYTPRGAREIPSAPYKVYAADAYAFVDIWRVPKGRRGNWSKVAHTYEGSFMSYYDAARPGFAPKKDLKPHPAAKHEMRLFKGDTVTILEGSNVVTMRVAGFSTTNNKLDLHPLNSANPPGHNYISINKLIGGLGMRKLLIKPDGTARNPVVLQKPRELEA